MIPSSITSTELRKIIMRMGYMDGGGVFPRGMEMWIDKQLCWLVDWLHAMGHRHTLEVELHFINTEGGLSKVDFARLLPGFMEKGAVTVIDGTRGVLYSTRNR